MLALRYLFSVLLLIAVSTRPGYTDVQLNSQDHQITTQDGTELSLLRYPATGEYLILWIAPGYGIHDRSMKVAQQLANKGIEVWQIDLAEALFLPRSTEQMRSFTGKYVADMIQVAHQQSNKNILLAARSYGAIPLLRGVRLWQLSKPDTAYVRGAILFSPDLYTTIPSLGLDPEYLPIASATNIPIMIFQDGIRGNRWYIDNLINTLMMGGSQPLLKILPGVSALFFDEDMAPETVRAISELPDNIQTSIKLLDKLSAPVTPATMKDIFKPVGSGIDIQLKKFKGNFLPHPLELKDAANKPYLRESYEGQITIVNFWATWCPPCVEEIPSLNRLRDKMQNIPFELVSINYAESAETVSEFLKKVDVKYPVLLDVSGKVSATWKVVAFPSTFIIGADGRIHYGVNAAIHWDSSNIVDSLNQLYRDTSR